MKRTVLLIMVTVLSCFLVFSASNINAQDACEGNFDCDTDVDGTDAAVFKSDFGRSAFKNPCDTCLDSPCPCTTTCPNNYELCVSNNDCDSGCCCEELDTDRCHDQTYCESVLGSQCVGLPGGNGEPCTANVDCASGNCECANESCTTKVCSAIECVCQFNTDGESSCDGFINPGITCGATSVCDGAGNCLKQNGEPCTLSIDCVSGFCPAEDGVCCDTMCSGTCEACLASKTGSSDGICGPVINLTDPDDECEADGLCAEDWCDGLGSCAYTQEGTVCGINGEVCDGLGNCI